MCRWHVHHEATLGEMESRARRGQELVLAAHSILESYAVLTRLPEPHLLAGDVAMELLEANWGTSHVISLSTADMWKLVREAPGRGVAGGQLYDAVIAACALKARAVAILTWNVRHFLRWADAMAIESPTP